MLDCAPGIVDNDQPDNAPGQEPNDDAPGGGREQDDQHADDGDVELRKLRAEAKRYRLERNEAQARLKEREDRDKTELQRLQDEAATATKRAEVAELAALKGRVAAQHGIPGEDAHRLQGTTRDELVEDAKAFAKRFGLDPASSSGGQQPPNFSSGVRRPVQRAKTMNDVIRQAAGR